ncbi:Pectate lyase L precursor [Posidoniimonas corsicana]|uniref:Probable pectate lyase C n=1 Tax=Posidoniimonas corsicana TaxID=1938618 RepID=A0A5C5VE32_9BACT|nr:right-handed parallel beta-helix repeat-containing protein [Posidoniimonas corsicana]TWT35935.1 Pectate lyase L precursor [Posidoniimonas corsicana]
MTQWRYIAILAALALGSACHDAIAAEYYIAPSGSDANNGSVGSPWGGFEHAISQLSPGDTLFVRGGEFQLDERLRIRSSDAGTESSPVRIWAYPGEAPVLDFSSMDASWGSSSGRGIQVDGGADWIHIKGLTIQNARDNGIWSGADHGVFEQTVTRWNGDSGLQLSGSASNNLILNADSYENYDPSSNGENADGFAIKFSDLGPGNVVRGARAWGNSDDGWDMWQSVQGGVLVEDSWAFDNGKILPRFYEVEQLESNDLNTDNFNGDGNGFKLGQDSGPHVLNRVVVWDNAVRGIDINGNGYGVEVSNSTVYDSGVNWHFDESSDETLNQHILRNNISFDGGRSDVFESGVTSSFNTWNRISVQSSDFLSLDDSIARGPRQADGSLPVSDFLRLAPGSGLIDAGVDVGLPFAGAAPDLGAFETAPALAGDFNNDGVVDAGDYTAWRDSLGAADETAINNAGDGMNGVDQEDYNVWRSNFGATAPTPDANADGAPEPAAAVLVMASLAAGLLARSRSAALPCLVLATGLLLPGAVTAQAPAFPGAEGFGGTFSGAAPAGGWFADATVYHVTNLNDDGPGSFREAFQQNSSNKIVVFDVGGTIQISDNIDIKNLSNYYIAGQTAPSPVTVYGDTVQLTHSGGKENRNVVLRYMSFRKGTGDGQDSITFAGGGLGTNMILDHLSASWSEDEILSVTNNNTNVTVQYTMINDALVNNHAYGSLLRPKISSNVTMHHNLYANNASRQARFGTYEGETLTADFRNNVVYNFRDRASYTGGSSDDEQEYSDINYVGNYIVAGPGTEGSPNYAFAVDKNVDSRVYQSGNYIDPDDAPGGVPADGVLDGTDTGWAMFRVSTPVTDQTLTQMATPFNTPSVATQAAPDAYNQVRDHVGNWWWDRDAIDSRVIGNLTDFTGVPIGASAPNSGELSALLAAPQTSHPAGYDTDGDAMPDVWEVAHGLNPNLASDWNLDFDNDGYINLIELINEKGEFPAPTPIAFEGAANARYADILNWRTDDGGVTAGSYWQPSRHDTAVISSGAVVVDAVGQHAGLLQVGVASGDDASLAVTGGWLMVDERVEVGSDEGIGRLTVSPAGTLSAPLVEVGLLGAIDGEGEIEGSVLNNGYVSPGGSAGVLMVDGNFVQSFAGVLQIDIGAADSFDQLLVSGDIAAAGGLDVRLLDGYSPAAGDSYNLLDWGGVKSGGFDAVLLPELGAPLAWDLSQLESAGVLAVTSASIAGDYNGDGLVDAADYTVWRDSLGSTEDLAADGDGSGQVDAADYNVWRTNYGATAASSARSVPEPTTLLLGVCLAGVGCRSRRG